MSGERLGEGNSFPDGRQDPMLTSNPGEGNLAAERLRLHIREWYDDGLLAYDDYEQADKDALAALLHERRATVERIRKGLWFLNPTQQEKAEAVYATASEEEARHG